MSLTDAHRDFDKSKPAAETRPQGITIMATDITKQYGAVQALKGVSVDFHAGDPSLRPVWAVTPQSA